jgi:hypothetical protein
MVVSAAITSTVTGATASSCQSAGPVPVFATSQAGEQCEASGDERHVDLAGVHCLALPYLTVI